MRGQALPRAGYKSMIAAMPIGFIAILLGSIAAGFYGLATYTRTEEYLQTSCAVLDLFTMHVDFEKGREGVGSKKRVQGFRPVWTVNYSCATRWWTANLTRYPSDTDIFQAAAEAANATLQGIPIGASQPCWCLPDVEPMTLEAATGKQPDRAAVQWAPPIKLLSKTFLLVAACVCLPIGFLCCVWGVCAHSIRYALGCDNPKPKKKRTRQTPYETAPNPIPRWA